MTIIFEKLKTNPLEFYLTSSALKIWGPDAKTYLQSQTTNDVERLDVNHFQFNAVLDLSGKILSAFILIKETDQSFYLLVSNDFLDATYERIEKYHISEDFEVEKINQHFHLLCHQDKIGFKGQYFFENDKIVISDQAIKNNQDFDLLKILTGTPDFGREAREGELINNTYFDELAVDYKKGCYPGQETVAKIKTRRGAAFKPVLLILDRELELRLENIYFEDKKIGEIRNSQIYENKTYIYALLNRENRIDKSILNFYQNENLPLKATVHYYPFLKPDLQSLAQEFYDEAIAFFHKNENDYAIKYFEKAIQANPQFEDAYESLGVLYGRLENYSKAIELMDKLKDINPNSMMAHTNLSLYHMKIGNIEIAEKYKADATVLNFQKLGDEAKIKREKEALAQKKQVEMKRRESMFLQVLDMDPEDAMANNGMGEISLENENYHQAKSYFQNAIKGNQKYSVAYLGLAKALYHLGEAGLLKETLLKGIAIASKNGDLMPANEMQAMLSKMA